MAFGGPGGRRFGIVWVGIVWFWNIRRSGGPHEWRYHQSGWQPGNTRPGFQRKRQWTDRVERIGIARTWDAGRAEQLGERGPDDQLARHDGPQDRLYVGELAARR
jgi:hypothetical protein